MLHYVFEHKIPPIGSRCWDRKLRCFWLCVGPCKTVEMVLVMIQNDAVTFVSSRGHA